MQNFSYNMLFTKKTEGQNEIQRTFKCAYNARWGGFISLGADELSTICKPPDSECTIKDAKYTNIQNTKPFSTTKITIETQITNFTNTSNLTLNSTDGKGITIATNGKIDSLINRGNISNGIFIQDVQNAITNITNYGEMQGIYGFKSQDITINNFGTIKTSNATYFTSESSKPAHFIFEDSSSKISLENYKITISETQSEFNNFKNYDNKTNNKNSHLIIWKHSNGNFVEFKDDKSKLLLDVGDGFEFGTMYKIAKLVTDQNGNSFDNLSLDFSRLALSDDIKDLYSLTNNGEYFIIKLLNKPDKPAILHTPITELYKSNIRTMNNFTTISNSMIYPRKYSKSQNLGRKNSKNILSLRASVAIQDLNVNDTFFYQNESQNLQTRRIQRQTKRNYSRSLKDSSLRADSQNLRGNPKDLRAKRSNHPQNSAESKPYYFILTPFVNHNYFFKSGRYNLSGFDYGFLTAFSARVAESNSLGVHFIMSYGSLSDSSDKNFHISNLNLNLGVNYKLDLIWDMYVKARGDFFYFLNQVKTLTMREAIKPNNLGFGLSVSYGKDFDFKQGGVLGIEAGLDYKALQSNKVSIDSQEYQQALYNLIYADVGLNYAKYFGGFGINLGGGFKANLAPNLAKVILLKPQNQIFALDNDKFLGYANLALSYVLNHRNFDMEFSLAYYGNFGDRIISNGGGFEWRVVF